MGVSVLTSENIDFESAIKELSEIVAQLENGAATLDESIALFERGIFLSKECNKKLQSARQKILTLTEAEEKSDNDD